MDYSGFEKRRAQRADVRFLVSYAVEDPRNGSMRDLTQTRNISALGAMVTTDKPLTPATAVAMKIRLPSQPVPIALQGQVVESKEVTRKSARLWTISATNPDPATIKILTCQTAANIVIYKSNFYNGIGTSLSFLGP